MDESVKYEDEHLKWKVDMPLEDRREADKENWKDIRDFIAESREYRAADAERQLNLLSDLSEIKAQTTETNGRVTLLETWRTGIDTKIEDKAKNKANLVTNVTIICVIVMAISAVIILFIKR